MAVKSPEAKAHKREHNREFMRAYRKTPVGLAAEKASKKKCLSDPIHREVKRAAHRRWKRTEKGRQCERRYNEKRYVPHPRPKPDPEETKRQRREYCLAYWSKPENAARKKALSRARHLRVTYGLTVEQHADMAAIGCHICGKRALGISEAHVDHDHVTGKVRGLLCDPCNRGLGCFRDNPARLRGAAAYLELAA